MKKLILLLSIITVEFTFADYSIPISHIHNGRQHTHQLPNKGVYHRHGIGSVGKPIAKAPRQTGTIVYANPQATVKPPKPVYPGYSSNPIDNSNHVHAGRSHTHLLPKQGVYHRHGSGPTGERIANGTRQTGTLVFGNTVPAQPQVNSQQEWRDKWKRNQHYSNRQRNRGYFSKGDTACRAGQLDCNVCAVNVQQQFQKAASQQISWRSIPWNFTWPQGYPPHNVRPLDVFNGDPAYALGIPDKHVQGFVRTNSRLYPYAGSHSHKRNGGIFVIKQGGDGQRLLSSLHQTTGRHPSGVHIIGKYLVYGEGNRLFFKDINSPNQQNDIGLLVPNALFGGGLGLLKLSGNSHLLVTTGPGGQDGRQRFNHFYHLESVNGRPASIRFLNKSTTKKPVQWPRGLAFSENLSLITECGTGDIYSIHTTGDEKGISAISGKGYWRLSKLVKSGKALGLTAVNAFTNRQNMKSCNVRAAATVHVNSQHRLEFYCHAYAKDPDGSAFNVLGRTSRNRDKFYFKVGVVE